jgi:hypothetical protein
MKKTAASQNEVPSLLQKTAFKKRFKRSQQMSIILFIALVNDYLPSAWSAREARSSLALA